MRAYLWVLALSFALAAAWASAAEGPSAASAAGDDLDLKWKRTLSECGLTEDEQGLGDPVSGAKPCRDPVRDALPGRRDSYNGLWHPSCQMSFIGPTEACRILEGVVDRMIVIGDSLTHGVTDALAMTIRGDAVLGYMAAPPVTPPELVEQCRCVLPRWKLVGKCQSRSLAALGRRAWEHWPKDHDGKITGLREWATVDLCGNGTLESFTTMSHWTTYKWSSRHLSDIEAVLKYYIARQQRIFFYLGGHPPHRNTATTFHPAIKPYNATFFCEHVIRPIARMARENGVPLHRIMVANMHNVERHDLSAEDRRGAGDVSELVAKYGEEVRECVTKLAPGAALLDAYTISAPAGPAAHNNRSATMDGLHASVRLDMVKVQMVLQHLRWIGREESAQEAATVQDPGTAP